MQILVFNERFIETAQHLAVRTGIQICNEDWKPEPHKGYILYGAEEQLKLLMEVQDKLDLKYIIMNGISPNNAFPEYLTFARDNKNTLICQNISWCAEYQKLEVSVEYGINEYFVNEPKPERRIHYLLWKEAEYTLPEKKKALYLSRDLTYTPAELTNKMTSCETYVSSRKDDWDMMHKAIACGMNVLSCREDADMEEIYKPFVCFVDDPSAINEKYEYPSYDNKLFLSTVATFSLNKMLPVIKDVYIQTEGEKRPENVIISTGEDENGETVVSIAPKEKENDTSSEV
jgi:hypothetical protein